MTKLSSARENVQLLDGLDLRSRGKVRDTYDINKGVPEYLLSLASDGVSIFDFVLNDLIPMKGIILNCMNHFWVEYLGQFGITTHLVAVGSAIDDFLPSNLRGNVDLQSRASVIRKMDMVLVEFIYRSVLTGSSVKNYENDGTVCGHRLLLNLQDGDSLPCILDTPTTKAQEGHDENIPFQKVRAEYPRQTMLGLQIFQICSQYCESRGIKLADTKFEFGVDGTIGDEIVTPDSSRFWKFQDWSDGRKQAKRKAPLPYDKQLVRAWGIELGVNKRDSGNAYDVAWVHCLHVPQKLIEQTTKVYRYIFWRLTGMTIEYYLFNRMGVAIEKKVPLIHIVCGSDSNVPTVMSVLSEFDKRSAKINLSVMSCHRNPIEVIKFTETCNAEAVICVGGKALALPGIVDAFLHYLKRDIPVIGVALGDLGSRSLLAAQLSIEELPSASVIMDEIDGVYTGADGLLAVINRVIYGELPPLKPRVQKPAQMDVFRNY